MNTDLENSKLRYTPDKGSGFTRVKRGKGFQFLDKRGKKVADQAHIERLQQLIIPPAWKNVWICPYINGHLQVTGIDERGRKQYIYHSEWNRLRQENKFAKILEFGKALPSIRKTLQRDLRKRTLTKQKVAAIALSIMEDTLIRAGNAHYRDKYKSYGLTTLTNRHVKIEGQRIFFKFNGKKSVKHEIQLSDRQLAKQLKQVMDIPGQELFQYYNKKNEVCTLDSGDLNDYLKCCTRQEFTSKDYRTWSGTVLAFRFLSTLEAYSTKKVCKKNILSCLDHVAKKLGNTRTVCRQYYVDAGLLSGYEEGSLQPYLRKALKENQKKNPLELAEFYLLKYLKQQKSTSYPIVS